MNFKQNHKLDCNALSEILRDCSFSDSGKYRVLREAIHLNAFARKEVIPIYDLVCELEDPLHLRSELSIEDMPYELVDGIYVSYICDEIFYSAGWMANYFSSTEEHIWSVATKNKTPLTHVYVWDEITDTYSYQLGFPKSIFEQNLVFLFLTWSNPKTKEKPESYVYFISSGSAIKIGMSACPESRLTSLQTANSNQLKLLKVVKGGSQKEQSFHREFQHLRLEGEWFQHSQEILQFIESL